MKKVFFLFILLACVLVQAQQIQTKKISLQEQTTHIELSAIGLDEIKIENSTSTTLEIVLLAENANGHAIATQYQGTDLIVGFEPLFQSETAVFKKFITERLQRASVLVKVPKNRTVIVYGKTVDVISKSYQGAIAVYIDRGLVNLHNVQDNASISLHQGNIYANVSNSSISVISNKGRIKVNDEVYLKSYKKEIPTANTLFKVSSIHANITLQTNFK